MTENPENQPCRETATAALLHMAERMQDRGERLLKQASGIRALVTSLTPEQIKPGSKINKILWDLCEMAQSTNPGRGW